MSERRSEKAFDVTFGQLGAIFLAVLYALGSVWNAFDYIGVLMVGMVLLLSWKNL